MNLVSRAALGLLPAVLASAALVAVPDAAHAASAPAVSTAYKCSSAYGSGTSPVRITAALPRTATAGRTVTARRIGVSITVPKKLVSALRSYQVDSVSGTASKAALRVGGQRVRLVKLKIPTTPVPATGAMVLKGTGSSAAFSVAEPGRYAVKVPASFAATVVARRGSDRLPVDLTCGRTRQAATTIETLKVVR